MKTIEESGNTVEFYENRQYGFLTVVSIFVAAVSIFLIFAEREQPDKLSAIAFATVCCLGIAFVWWSRSRDRLLLTLDQNGIHDLKHGKILWSHVTAIEHYWSGRRSRTSYIGFVFADDAPKIKIWPKWQLQLANVLSVKDLRYQYSICESDLPMSRMDFKKLLISKFPEIMVRINIEAI